MVGALANLGHPLSDQTVGNILRRHGIAPVPERRKTTTWRDFIRRHMDVLVGTDFFTVDVLTWRSLVTYYVLFFIHLDSRVRDLLVLCRAAEARLSNMTHGAGLGPYRPPLVQKAIGECRLKVPVLLVNLRLWFQLRSQGVFAIEAASVQAPSSPSI
jgi:hypothetical protein